MLNGIDPLFIFNFPAFVSGETFKSISGIPVVGNFLVANIGLPIPIYLSEQTTGMVLVSESKALDVDTESKQRFDGEPPDVKQRGVNNLVTVNLSCQKDSTYLTLFLALNDLIFQRLVSQRYNLSYMNGPTTVFNGLLHGFSANGDNSSNRMDITIQISKANLKATQEPPGRFYFQKITGALPVPSLPSLPGGL